MLDRIIVMILGNPNFMGAVIACFLDNTVPGEPFINILSVVYYFYSVIED